MSFKKTNIYREGNICRNEKKWLNIEEQLLVLCSFNEQTDKRLKQSSCIDLKGVENKENLQKRKRTRPKSIDRPTLFLKNKYFEIEDYHFYEERGVESVWNMHYKVILFRHFSLKDGSSVLENM